MTDKHLPATLLLTRSASTGTLSLSAADPRFCTMMAIFFFNDRATPEIYPFSLPDALPIYPRGSTHEGTAGMRSSDPERVRVGKVRQPDRKSTRLNSSHLGISYAVFCL